jgi:hypothetical protein
MQAMVSRPVPGGTGGNGGGIDIVIINPATYTTVACNTITGRAGHGPTGATGGTGGAGGVAHATI